MAESPKMLMEKEGPLGWITFNQPEKRNAVSQEMWQMVPDIVKDLEEDGEIRVIILRGAGDQAFVAGADIAEYAAGDHAAFVAYQAESRRLFSWLDAFGKPVIGAVNGYALGGGFELCLCCDLLVASTNARFGLPEGLLGLSPGGGGTQRLTRLIGTHRSLVAILEGKPFTPAEALANGAVDEVVPREDVVTRATELAEHFGSRPKGAVAAVKRAVYFGGSMSLSEGLHVERTEFLIADQSKDAQDLMIDYLATTEATGELPLYNPDTYARALESGRVPGRRSPNGAVSRR